MLPQKNRLPTPLVSEILKRGKRISLDALQFSYLKSDSGQARMTTSRFAVVAGVKVSKKAVERNRVKRLIRESIHHLLPSVVPVDGVFVARKGLVGEDQASVEGQVKELFHKAQLLTAES